MASNAALDITLSVESQHRDIEISVEKSVMPPPEYEGPYRVVPRLYYGHILETARKSMRENVTVDAIQIYEVSNPVGGKTVTIGSV